MKRIFTLTAAMVFIMAVSASAADSIKEMFAEGTLSGKVMMLDFTRDFDGATNTRRDSAIGGLMYYKSAPLAGISFGAAFGTVNDMFSNDDDDVYSILAKDDNNSHESVTRLQEYYIQGEWFNTTIKYGAQEINTPFMNIQPNRMLPRTYKGLSVVNKSVAGLKLSAYYITDSMGWTDDDFISLSQAVATGPGGIGSIDEDKPMYIAGVGYDIPVDFIKTNIQGWYYLMPDVYSNKYLQFDISKALGDFTLFFKPSILYQQSKGDELNGELDTTQTGFRTGVKAYGFTVTGYYASIGDDALLTPWGDGKIVQQQVYASGRADEDSTALKVEYDFGKIGAKGLSSYILYGIYDTPESGATASNDMTEVDYSVQYKFSGMLDGLALRARYATIDIEDGEDIDDLRFYVTYSFSFSGK
jgi:hypothetical protein